MSDKDERRIIAEGISMFTGVPVSSIDYRDDGDIKLRGLTEFIYQHAPTDEGENLVETYSALVLRDMKRGKLLADIEAARVEDLTVALGTELTQQAKLRALLTDVAIAMGDDHGVSPDDDDHSVDTCLLCRVRSATEG